MKLRKQAAPIWTNTEQIGYMADPQRQGHGSHDAFERWLRVHFSSKNAEMLDCGVMSGVSWERLRQSDVAPSYVGVDISERVIDDRRAHRPDATWLTMSVMDLVFDDDSFDVVLARHLLENLPYYETAVREMFRVSRQYVVLCFFQPPAEPEVLLRRRTENGYIWFNRYSPDRFDTLLADLADDIQIEEIESGGRMDRIYFCRKRDR
ncbi:class I SAM-dependent methyltransferase [Microbacterium enclense]|uniref:class I SAM-dependent methyltransferase n=1 Tax=Microbacterium enclense TaxID=993073 RepID=UPI003F7F6C04